MKKILLLLVLCAVVEGCQNSNIEQTIEGCENINAGEVFNVCRLNDTILLFAGQQTTFHVLEKDEKYIKLN